MKVLNLKISKILFVFISIFMFNQIGFAQTDLITKKQIFKMSSYKTVGGKIIKNLQVGWESYGKLNAKKDNVILICHPFTGSSHAAGKYTKNDKTTGYWDSIIGPKKAIDTDKYFVISIDSLVNLNTKNPNVITTGPASINPDTGKHYAMSFPIVTIKDFVNVQKAVITDLGIKKIHAVAGASMGSMQTYEWAASYPTMVNKIMPVIGTAYASSHLIALTHMWSLPVLSDPNWNNGNYYNKKAPLGGLTRGLEILTLNTSSFNRLNKNFGRKWTNQKNPLNSFDSTYKIQNYFDSTAIKRAKTADANHFLYLIKANQLYYAGQEEVNYKEGIKNIKAPTLLIYSPLDIVFYPQEVENTADLIRANGTKVTTLKLGGDSGHIDGVITISQFSKEIKKFIEN